MLCDRFLFQDQWSKIGVQHHHGIALPLSALHTKNRSSGIGEILDLIPLIDWLAKIDFSILQLLPINDSGDDPSPYMAISAYALHPIYLSLSQLSGINTCPSFATFEAESHHLCMNQQYIEYHSILKKKLDILREYVDSTQGKSIQLSQEYLKFFEEERDWLLPYSLFKAFKEKNNGKAWWHFHEYKNHPTYPEEVFEKNPCYRDEVHFWAIIQYLLFQQWKEVQQHAHRNRIRLMGDLPILVNKDSADVWWNPELFALDKSVGAPPDIYSRDGQVWGFPLYRWDHMDKRQYQWFSRRLQLQEKLYDIYRIDHIVGLFRFWAIPPGKKAKEGTFIPISEKEWIAQGEKNINILAQATTMLPIGEDLGDIPNSVRTSLHALGVPSYKVLRWERDWENQYSSSHARYIHPTQFSPESLVTVSTHDSSTLEGWWNEDISDTQNFCYDMALTWNRSLTDNLRYKILELSHRANSLFHIHLFQEYLAFFPELSWMDPEHDRINIPGTVSKKNWTWKTRVSLETIIEHNRLSDLLISFTK